MTYINTSDFLIDTPYQYITKQWVNSAETSFAKKYLLARGVYLGLTPASAITSAVDTIVGIGLGFTSILTLGKKRTIFQHMLNYLSSTRKIISRPYVNLIKTLDPVAQLSVSLNKKPLTVKSTGELIVYKPPFISGEGDGLITDLLLNSLKDIARQAYFSPNLFKRHIVSRLTYILLATSVLVTRVIDGIIGTIAATFSLLTLGNFESLNNVAYRGLQTPGIVADLFYCTIKIINPWAGVFRQE